MARNLQPPQAPKTQRSLAEDRVGSLEAAVGAHGAGAALALKVTLLEIARQGDLDIGAVIAALDREVAALPLKPIDPRGMIATATADLLRLATQAKS